jgi:hypothetical protein
MRVGHDEGVHPLIERGLELLRELLLERTEIES